MQASLRVVHPKANVQHIKLLEETVIGRSADCHLKIASNQVSRKHCCFRVGSNSVSLEDLGSSNGTVVNGKTIAPHQPVTLSAGDQIMIGPAQFVLAVKEGSATAAKVEPATPAEPATTAHPEALAAASVAAAAAGVAATAVEPPEEEPQSPSPFAGLGETAAPARPPVVPEATPIASEEDEPFIPFKPDEPAAEAPVAAGAAEDDLPFDDWMASPAPAVAEEAEETSGGDFNFGFDEPAAPAAAVEDVAEVEDVEEEVSLADELADEEDAPAKPAKGKPAKSFFGGMFGRKNKKAAEEEADEEEADEVEEVAEVEETDELADLVDDSDDVPAPAAPKAPVEEDDIALAALSDDPPEDNPFNFGGPPAGENPPPDEDDDFQKFFGSLK